MKQLSFLILILFSTLLVYPQSSSLKKSNRGNNTFVYKGKSIKIYPGQRISVGIERKLGRVKHLTLMDTTISQITDFKMMTRSIESMNPEKNLCLDFNIIHPDPSKTLGVLLVKNPTEFKMTFKAKVYSEEKHRYIKAEVLPIIPGLTGITTWTYKVPSIILYRFKLKEMEKEFE